MGARSRRDPRTGVAPSGRGDSDVSPDAGNVSLLSAQIDITDEQLEAASEGRTVVIGSTTGERRAARIPLEVYVARVLAGEGEPNAPDAARQALAVAIRTYTLVQMGRHRREGFDLCDTVHCQVLRPANESSRRAALATARRVLTVNGVPAELFYSASCGGRSEGAAQVWPGATFPYMQVVRDDDVHEEDVPWTLDLTLDELRQALARAGFGGGPLRNIEIDGYNGSRQSRASESAGHATEPDQRAGISRRVGNDAITQHGVHPRTARERRPVHRDAGTDMVWACA